ncbi:MAG: type II secretion system F family protein [Methanobacteriaceae archaeon]
MELKVENILAMLLKYSHRFDSDIVQLINNKIPHSFLEKMQEYLIQSNFIFNISEFLAMIVLVNGVLTLFFVLMFVIMGFDILIAILLGIFVLPTTLSLLVVFRIEKRKDLIESAAPDFFRQLSSMLRVGMSFEGAMGEISNYSPIASSSSSFRTNDSFSSSSSSSIGNSRHNSISNSRSNSISNSRFNSNNLINISNPLHDEIKRALIEIKMGKSFDEAFNDMNNRLKSKNIKRAFQIILEGRKSGGSLAEVIENVADDLRAVLVIKKERKTSTMMGVMFLVISAVIAAPFSLGMVGIYSSFMESLGKESELITTALTAAGSYIIIHSILVGLIIGVIMYGNFKKGIKFSIPLAIVSYGIFYLVSTLGPSFLGLSGL